MSREDEGRLADRLIAGDPAAFPDLVRAYQRKVYGLAFEMTRNHADAEDISQVSFMKIHRAVGTIKRGRGLNAWLYRIVYRTALDHIRKRTFYPPEGLPAPSEAGRFVDPADRSAGPEAPADAACLRRRIDAALAKVSRRERTAVILRHYHDLKLKDIAGAMGVSLGAAKSYLFRGLRKLQAELAEAEACPGDGDRS